MVLLQSYWATVPTLLIVEGFRFYFFSNERQEPPRGAGLVYRWKHAGAQGGSGLSDVESYEHALQQLRPLRDTLLR
jgi:hypothetical protein